eukprot:SAG22_NODE_1936_length_3290_cov_2.130367_1_plen_411_part_00
MIVGPTNQPAAEARPSKKLVLTCLLMASSNPKGSAGGGGAGGGGAGGGTARPMSIPISQEVNPDACMPSPVFSPTCGPIGADDPRRFDRDAQASGEEAGPGPGPGTEVSAVPLVGLPPPAKSTRLLEDVQAALRSGGGFAPAEEGDGVWIVVGRDGSPVAVWKSNDGEPQDRSNMSAAIERGCACGQRAQREYMAYLYDLSLPAALRAGVPPTLLVQLGGGRRAVGSIQRFVPGKGSSEDWGCSQFGSANVQRIAIFDLLTTNLDRHGGNMLVDNAGVLVPIDHGYALPDNLAGEPWLDWRLWPQAGGPVEPALRAAVAGLDPRLAQPLADGLGLPPGVWQTAATMTRKLQANLAAGASLRQVAESLMPETVSADSMAHQHHFAMLDEELERQSEDLCHEEDPPALSVGS